MDISTIIVGVLALAGSLAGTYFSNNKTTALMAFKIEQLTDKVNKHNSVIERMTIAEQSLKQVWKQIDEIKGELK